MKKYMFLETETNISILEFFSYIEGMKTT